MSMKLKAADDIRTLANRFKAIIEVADMLEAIGSLEQAAQEAMNRRDAAVKAEAEQDARLLAVKMEVKEMQGGLAAIEAKGLEIEKMHQEKAAKIVDDANLEASAVLFEAQEKKAALAKEYAKIRFELDKLRDEYAAQKEVLESLKKEIEQVRGKFAKFMA